MPMCLVHSNALYRQCLLEIMQVVSRLMKCQSERTCRLVRRWAVLRALRTLEDIAGQAILQITPWSSCSLVSVKHGSNL